MLPNDPILATREPSRAGFVTHANLNHLDQPRHPSGADSGEVVKPPGHAFF
jgi:hypothetical protein